MRFQSLAAWLDWQAGLNPRSIDLGLDRVRQVWQQLGPPQLEATVITVAGTNGKGSSVALCDAMLRAAGYRTACYTSPHLAQYNERIRVDGSMADDATICAAFERVDQARADTRLTYFEFGTLAALLVFADAALDAVVLEVGLGGRLDAVNLIDPDVALVTAIGLDHQAWLGNDLETIGAEKAGIFRPARPAVFSGRQMPHSVRDVADRLGASLYVAGSDFQVQVRNDGWDFVSPLGTRRALPLPAMRGRMQVDNAAGVLMALACVADRLPVDQQAVRDGLLSTQVPGRFEVRPGAPTWILDVAHNPQAAQALASMLGDFPPTGRMLAVCGMLGDKDVAAVAATLVDRFDAWYLVDLSHEARGLSDVALAESIGPLLGERQVLQAGAIDDALARAQADAQPEDIIVVFGSFMTVGPARAWLEAQLMTKRV